MQSRRQGVTLVLFVLCTFVLVGVAAFAVDWGLLTYTKHQLQNFVDAAALAGGQDLPNADSARQSATANYARNYADNFRLPSTPNPVTAPCTDPVSSETICYRIASDEVQITTPYAFGNDPPSPNRIHVRACRVVPLFFARLLGMSSRRVCAEAVVRGSLFPRGMVVLDGGGSQALFLRGNARLHIPNGSVIVNSNASDAIFAQNNAWLRAKEILVTGNFQTQGNAVITPTPQTNQPPVPDPLANLPPPSTSGLPVFPGQTIGGNSVAVLQPGIYTGLVWLRGNAFVTMQPGIYILREGLLVSGYARLVGNGVMLYVEGGQMEVRVYDKVDLTPPDSGTYKGILIFQARKNENSLTFTYQSKLNLEGTIYLPNATLYLPGNAVLKHRGMIVAWRVDLSGTSFVTIQAEEPPSATGGDTGIILER